MMSAKYKKKGALVPRLRFSEFIGDREWDCAQMGDIYAFKKNNSFSRDMLNYNAGDVKNIHYGDIHKKFSSHFYAENENIPFVNCNINLGNISEDCLCTAGDIIFADASEDIKDIGKCIEIISNNKERILSGLHTIFTRQFSSTLVIGFGGYLFQSPRVRAQIQKEAQGTKILGISSGRLAKISISFPFAKGEQQKIADCLSSLDERIAAETNKLDALKAHKKGLLKQLFPAEGETLPQLRFPEFQDAGEWEEVPLSKLVSSLDAGVSVNAGDRPATSEEMGILKTSAVTNGVFEPQENKVVLDVVEIGRMRESVRRNTIIISRMNTPALVGANAYVDTNFENIFLPDRLWAAKPKPDTSMRFISFILSSNQGRATLALSAKGSSGSMKNITKSDVLAFLAMIPSLPEQQRIADCLSSLDELITAQTQKIDLLKEHKKGLMQQLFPRIDEVRA